MNIVEYLGYGLTLAIIGLGYNRLPDYNFLWGAIAIALLTIVAKRGAYNMLVMLLVAILVVIVSDDKMVIPFLVLIGMPSIAIALAVSQFGMFGKVVSYGFVGGILGFLVYWGYLALLGEHLAIHPVESFFAGYYTLAMEAWDMTDLGEIYTKYGLTKNMLAQWFKSFLNSLTTIRPGLYIIGGWAQILLGLVSAKIVLGSRGYLIREPFANQMMPWQLDWVMIAGLAAWLAGTQWNIKWPVQAGANVIFLIAPIAFYFGLSLLVYVFQRWDIKAWLIWGLILLLLFMPVQAFFFIAILGIFDPLIDYRDLDGKRGSTT